MNFSDPPVNLADEDLSRVLIGSNITIATDTTELLSVSHFLEQKHSRGYPATEYSLSMLEEQSFTLFSKDKAGTIDGVALLKIDKVKNLPESEYLTSYIAKNRLFCRWHVFALRSETRAMFWHYLAMVYSLSMECACDAVLMTVRTTHVPFYKRMIGVQVVNEDSGTSSIVWELRRTNSRFFRMTGLKAANNQENVTKSESSVSQLGGASVARLEAEKTDEREAAETTLPAEHLLSGWKKMIVIVLSIAMFLFPVCFFLIYLAKGVIVLSVAIPVMLMVSLISFRLAGKWS